MKIPFVKMHGIGNDFVLLNGSEVPPSTLKKNHIKKLCDRRKGVGADQVLLIRKTQKPDTFDFFIWNSDGSKALMCGNGIRCAAHYLWQKSAEERIFWKTPAGRRETSIRQVRESNWAWVRVDMGVALIETLDETNCPKIKNPHGQNTREKLSILGLKVDMGNPHFVIQAEDSNLQWRSTGVCALGPQLERHSFFGKQGSNIELVWNMQRKAQKNGQSDSSKKSSRRLLVDVWERGSGNTQACGTGACAAASAQVELGFSPEQELIPVKLPGGELQIEVSKPLHTSQDPEFISKRHVWMEGPSEMVFKGELFI
jgi:diaminopimelate epimerase